MTWLDKGCQILEIVATWEAKTTFDLAGLIRTRDLEKKIRVTSLAARLRFHHSCNYFFLLCMFWTSADKLLIDGMPTVVAALMNSTAQQTVFVVVPPPRGS